ncbi:MAG: hypothetical protein AAFX81_00640 [Pseudomonadota bacterium]
MKFRSLLLLLVATHVCGATAVRAEAAAEPAAELCLQAIAAEEPRHAWLPEGLMRAMALVESGHVEPGGARAVPWPWTINSPAGSFYLSSRAEAVAKVEELQAQGVSNIDVGCMQVSLLYHPRAFESLDQAFDPATNVAYAAGFLSALKAEGASVFGAVGRYHSRTPVLGVMYARKVFARWGYGGRLGRGGAG